MYAIAFYPTEDHPGLAELNRYVRDWLGSNAEPGSWDTAFANGQNIAPVVKDRWGTAQAVTAMIESEEDAAYFRLWYEGDTHLLATYPKYTTLRDQNIKGDSYNIVDEVTRSGMWKTMWTDGLFVYYTGDEDLVWLKMRYS